MESAACDRCGGRIPRGEGYAFYSSAQMMGMTIGNLLLCESCTAEVVSAAGDMQPFRPTAVDPGDEMAMQETMQAATAAGMVERWRALGLSPEEARHKGRELALGFWSGPAAGSSAARSYWTSPPAALPRIEKAPEVIEQAPEPNADHQMCPECGRSNRITAISCDHCDASMDTAASVPSPAAAAAEAEPGWMAGFAAFFTTSYAILELAFPISPNETAQFGVYRLLFWLVAAVIYARLLANSCRFLARRARFRDTTAVHVIGCVLSMVIIWAQMLALPVLSVALCHPAILAEEIANPDLRLLLAAIALVLGFVYVVPGVAASLFQPREPGGRSNGAS